MSLVDFYEKLASADQVEPEITEDDLLKMAMDEAVIELANEMEDNSEPEIDEGVIKTAQEYDAAGRIMARGFFAEMLKQAQENEEGKEEEEKGEEDEDEEKKKKEKAKGLPPALAAAMKEKTAQIKQAMLEDPKFAEQVLAQYEETE